MTGNGLFLRMQKGVVLVLSLLILLVLTIVGVAAMNSTMMQERMAGNTRTQTLAFEEASGGVSQGLDFFYEHIQGIIDSGVVDNEWGLACGVIHSDFDDDDGAAWVHPEGGFAVVSEANNLRLEQRMYCCQNWVQDGDFCVQNPSKLFVLSRGTFLDGQDGNDANRGRLASREVEIRLEEADPDDPTCAICIPGGVGGFEAGNSNALQVHGECGPAITTETGLGAATIIDGISDKNMSNYDGGIVAGDMGLPWNDPVALAEFVFWAKLGLPHTSEVTGEYGYWSEDDIAGASWSGNVRFGTQANPQITYFDGSVNVGGNPSGWGIMIVNGELEWRGNADFNGLLIVLGGGYTVSGGGNGGVVGSIVATNLEDMVPRAHPTMDRPDLLEREALRYPVSEVGGDVEMYPPDPTEDDRRPVLLDNAMNKVFPVLNNRGLLTGFQDVDGNAITHNNPPGTNNLELEFADGSITTLEYIANDTFRPRDKFGRLMPDFVWRPLVEGDNSKTTWPPDEYGYDPNEWGWDPPGAAPFEFNYDEGADLIWSGGGNQTFRYDCRRLQHIRHRLLCVSKHPDHDPELDVDDDFYENPDHASVCNHWDTGFEYNDDILNLGSNTHNQHAWHLWDPGCDCMGITANSDMIISGWRENLGWRDDDAFEACGLALSRSERCDL